MSHFDAKAKEWDKGQTRVDGTLAIARAIEKRHQFHPEMEVMDFGVGTGLLGFEIAPRVKKVYGIDTSKEMLEQVKRKNRPECSIEVLHQDILQNPLTQEFDALISSMTLHHIEDLELFFRPSTRTSNAEVLSPSPTLRERMEHFTQTTQVYFTSVLKQKN